MDILNYIVTLRSWASPNIACDTSQVGIEAILFYTFLDGSDCICLTQTEGTMLKYKSNTESCMVAFWISVVWMAKQFNCMLLLHSTHTCLVISFIRTSFLMVTGNQGSPPICIGVVNQIQSLTDTLKPLFNKRFQITIANKCLLWELELLFQTFYLKFYKFCVKVINIQAWPKLVYISGGQILMMKLKRWLKPADCSQNARDPYSKSAIALIGATSSCKYGKDFT